MTVSRAEVVTEILNVTLGEEAVDLASNDISKSLDTSQVSVESESINSEVMDTTVETSSESALQSPDSAIGVTPSLTPDQEFQNRVPEKVIFKPTHMKEDTPEPTKVKMVEIIEPLRQRGNDEEDRSLISVVVESDQNLHDFEQQNSIQGDNHVNSEDGYADDVEHIEDEAEDTISDTEVVLSASMQFPLSSKPEREENVEGSLQVESEHEGIKQERHSPLESSTGVTVEVRSQVSVSSTKEGSPSGCDSDVEDNDEHSEKEPLVSLSQPKLAVVSRIPSSLEMPDTVTRLDNAQGSSVFLVGTAHFSRESQEDVANTIRLVKPDIVVVELCKARTAILQLDEETILEESRSLDFKKMQMILRQHGKIQGILYLLLLSVSAHITKQLGMAPGGEFRTAFAEARKSAPGCLIQLGDRPIQITLSRALASLSLWHKVKLTWHILTSKEPISKEEVEKCKQRDFIEEMLAEMTGQFPAISEVFVKERDLYLCRSLQAAAQAIPNPLSPSGLSPRVVVGVVGIGHVPGIVTHWGKVTDADIAPIMRIPPQSLSSKILKITFKMSIYGLLGYGVYKCLPTTAKSAINSSVQSAVTSVSSVLPIWRK